MTLTPAGGTGGRSRGEGEYSNRRLLPDEIGLVVKVSDASLADDRGFETRL